MRIILEIHLNIDGNRLSRAGEFRVRKAEEIAGVAHEFIQSTKHETGHRQTVIEKVILNSEHDITDLVLEIENQPIQPLDDIWW